VNTTPSVIPAKAGIHPDRQPNRPDCFVARLDKKFTAALKMLTKYNPKGPDSFLNPDDFNRITSSQRLS
jgi:hypothetical protein